jgi:hypothetical protein
VFQKRIHVFKAGDQTSAQGVQRHFSEKDLEQVVKTYDPSIHEAPLVIGHAGDNDSLPAYGWIKGFSQQGGNLYADVAFTDTAKDLVKDGHYRKVSISFYSPDSAINPHKGKWSARHLALLGASPPAVKGLEPFTFSEMEGVYDFAVALAPSDIFDEDLGPTLIVEKSPLEMLREKLDEVRQDVSSAVKDLQDSQQSQPTEQLEEVATSSVTEQPEAAQMANPDAPQFKESSKNVGREGTEISQQTADLETQFPEEEFMEKGKISRKHEKGAHGQVMQVVENVYEEAHKESTAERKEAADRGFERKRQLAEGKKGEAHETEELMKLKDKKLSDDHKEGYNARLDESLGARNGKKSQSMKDRRDESEGMEKAEGKRKYAGDKSMDHSELEYDEVSYKTSKNGKVSFGVKKGEIEDDEGRYETARSDSDGYVDRMKTGKAGADARTGRMHTAKSSEQDEDRMHTAKSAEQSEDRLHTAKDGEFGKGDTGRWAGQEDGYDQVHNNDQYDAGKEDYPEGSRPEESTGTDPYGRKETATKIPVETEEMPDNEVFAVQMQNVMSDKNMRVMRQGSNSAGTKVATHNYMYGEPQADEMTGDDGVTTAKKGMTASKTVEHGEYDSGDLGGGASFDKLREEVGDGKPAKNKLLTPGAQDSIDDPAAIVGPDGAYAESYKGEPKSKNKLLVPGEQDSVTDPAETVGPGGAYKEASLDQLRDDIGDGKPSKAKQLKPGAQGSLTDPAEISKRSGGVYSEEHGEKKDPYTKTGYGSTGEYLSSEMVDEGETDYNELSVDHCGMDYGMGSNAARPMGLSMGMAEQMKAELEKLKAEHAELQRMYMEKEIAHRKGKIHSFVEALYEEGRLTDGIMPQGELISYCEGLEFGTLEFSEGETSATKLLGLLSKLPPMVSFGEVAGGTFQYAEEDLDPHARALKMVEESDGAVDYVEALKRTMFS